MDISGNNRTGGLNSYHANPGFWLKEIIRFGASSFRKDSQAEPVTDDPGGQFERVAVNRSPPNWKRICLCDNPTEYRIAEQFLLGQEIDLAGSPASGKEGIEVRLMIRRQNEAARAWEMLLTLDANSKEEFGYDSREGPSGVIENLHVTII